MGMSEVVMLDMMGHMVVLGMALGKDDDDWVKKCMEYEVQGPRPRGRPKRTWREVVREDCQVKLVN